MVNKNTLLLRQIHPNFIRDEIPTSQAFEPSDAHESKLSVYDGDKMQPAEAYHHYTDMQKLASSGVQAVSVSECYDLQLSVIPDPIPFPEHMLIDFAGCASKGERRRKAKLLREKARIRGWLYRP